MIPILLLFIVLGYFLSSRILQPVEKLKAAMKQVKKKKTPQKEVLKQLDFGIKEPFKNKILKLKGKTDIMLLQIEVKKFFKDAFFWFVAVIDTVMLLQQGYILYTSYKISPTYLPLLGYNLESESKLTNKYMLFIFPAITLIGLITSIIITGKYYNREKLLTRFILFCTILASIACTILLTYLIQNY